jgi:uroporphyrin-III C-methyltransferase/precorrin-2 dehydrogenase/sirohydrochlorin ferrochelatase
LAIAATNDRLVNQQITMEAERLNAVLNVVDDPDLCAFIAPSVIERGSVTVEISTGSASPALARKMRETLANDPALEWADLAPVLSRAQKEIKKRGSTVDTQRWQCSLTRDLLQLALSGREEEALDQLLRGLLDQISPWLCPDLNNCRNQGCSTGG